MFYSQVKMGRKSTWTITQMYGLFKAYEYIMIVDWWYCHYLFSLRVVCMRKSESLEIDANKNIDGCQYVTILKWLWISLSVLELHLWVTPSTHMNLRYQVLVPMYVLWTPLATPLHCHIKHDDATKCKHLPRFVRGIHRSPVNSPHKGQWRGALMFSLICVWINGWVNNCEAGELMRHRAHHDVTVMIHDDGIPWAVVYSGWDPMSRCLQ